MGNVLKAVIFDFNGVIVDDEPLHLELFRRVLEEEGLTLFDKDYYKKYLGYDDRRCFIAILTDAGRIGDANYIDRLITRKTEYYRAAIQNRSLLFPGVVELVKRLRLLFPLAVVSGALRSEIDLALELGGISDCFQVIVAAGDVSACKPDPEGYLKALALLNSLSPYQQMIMPAECLVIEDSIAGIASSKRAGMRCLAVTSSYRADELKEADWIVRDLIDCDKDAIFRAL